MKKLNDSDKIDIITENQQKRIGVVGMSRKRKTTVILAVTALFFAAAVVTGGCSRPAGEIRFADVGWDSVKFHNAVAGLVAESAFGYTWKEVPGSSPIMHEAMLKGEIDVNMEDRCAVIQHKG